MPTTDDGATHDTERHRRRLSAQHLTPHELYRQCLEALHVLAFGTPLERETFFGEPVHVNAR